MTPRRAGVLVLLAALLASGERAAAHADDDDAARLDAEATRIATEVQIAPSSRGAIGAWLVAGPRPAGERGFDALGARELEAARGARLGDAALGTTWRIAWCGDGPVDLLKALGAQGRSGMLALASAVLQIPRRGRYLLLLGVDDGVQVHIDGRLVHARDEARPVREDDDVVALALEPGEHSLVLAFHQRDGAWAFRARLLDEALAAVPGVFARLPGTSAEDARSLATRMSWVSFERTIDPTPGHTGYAPNLIVRFPEGAPRGVPLDVRARLEGVFDVRAGAVPVTAEGVGELSVALPRIPPAAVERVLEVEVAGRSVKAPLPSRPSAEAAVARAKRLLSAKPDGGEDAARATFVHLTRRLDGLVSRGDPDAGALDAEARELDEAATHLERGEDPMQGRTGPMRRALRSRLDGGLSELGVYVPPSYRVGPASDAGAARTYPLVVALHGMNGYPLAMIRWLFGGDDPKHDQAWEDRHVGPLPPVDAFVIAPSGRGNTMYRDVGEEDVAEAIAWASATFPIDRTRITITGPSMGGIGAASIPLRRAGVFAAAEPLCGYHSLFVRRDVAGRPLRPWERFLAEERSAASWAENGEHLPLFIVHGTRDLPVENSGVLVDRYEKLGYAVRHEHPDLGHNVWQPTYENLAGMRWLLGRRLAPSPRHVRFRTPRTRWATGAWVTVEELASSSGWGEVDARVRARTKLTATTSGVTAVTFARDPALLEPSEEITVELDGRALVFGASEELTAHVPEGAAARAWEKGRAASAGSVKRGRVTGPLRDVLFEPALVVTSTAEPERRASEEVGRALSRVRAGLSFAYPVLSDAEFLARGEALANDRALIVVGRKNRVLAELERVAPSPIRVEDGEVIVGAERLRGKELGAAFIRPNPARPDRYLVVVAGADVPGLLRATSLPDLLPDFVVWDASVAPSRGQILLGAGALRAAGFFARDWSLPAGATFADPLATAKRAAPRSEHDATPYLP